METLKHSWRKVPATIRKPIVFVVGLLFVIAAGLTGWLPGPGGIPLFLVGIAILSTEFEWAKTIRDYILGIIYRIGDWLKAHKVLGTLAIAVLLALFVYAIIFAYENFWR